MVKIAVGLFLVSTVLAMIAFSLAELAWLGLVILTLAVGALASGYVIDLLDARAAATRRTHHAGS